MKSQDWTDYKVFFGAKGRQGDHYFYVVTMKLREVFENFKFYLTKAEELPDVKTLESSSGRKKYIKQRDASVEEDIQRLRHPKKVSEIESYILSNPRNWVFSSLTASCGDKIHFSPMPKCGDRIGAIRIRKGSQLLINDGQHRADAIGKIWNDKKLEAKSLDDFGDQSISVVIFDGHNTKRMQQMFVDLQKGTPVNQALAHELSPALEDVLVRQIRDSVPLFKNYVVKDQTSIARGSRKLFSHKVFFDANKYVFGAKLSKVNANLYYTFLTKYWEAICEQMTCWHPFMQQDSLDTDEFRRENLSHLSVTMHAFGMIASHFYHTQNQKKGFSGLKNLSKINWSRTKNKRLFKHFTTSENKMANSKEVRMAVRDYLLNIILQR